MILGFFGYEECVVCEIVVRMFVLCWLDWFGNLIVMFLGIGLLVLFFIYMD